MLSVLCEIHFGDKSRSRPLFSSALHYHTRVRRRHRRVSERIFPDKPTCYSLEMWEPAVGDLNYLNYLPVCARTLDRYLTIKYMFCCNCAPTHAYFSSAPTKTNSKNLINFTINFLLANYRNVSHFLI